MTRISDGESDRTVDVLLSYFISLDRTAAQFGYPRRGKNHSHSIVPGGLLVKS